VLTFSADYDNSAYVWSGTARTANGKGGAFRADPGQQQGLIQQLTAAPPANAWAGGACLFRSASTVGQDDASAG
jgi:hypothetical protein